MSPSVVDFAKRLRRHLFLLFFVPLGIAGVLGSVLLYLDEGASCAGSLWLTANPGLPSQIPCRSASLHRHVA